MVVGFTTTYVISAYHSDGVSLNLDQGEVYNIYVIKFVSDLRQVSGFLWVVRFPSPIN